MEQQENDGRGVLVVSLKQSQAGMPAYPYLLSETPSLSVPLHPLTPDPLIDSEERLRKRVGSEDRHEVEIVGQPLPVALHLVAFLLSILTELSEIACGQYLVEQK